jgi:HAE1 family hydrophobic/amphiphilic exporter-1
MGMSYKSFGLTLIGGMTSGTLLTLLVVPVFYTLFDDAQQAIRNTLASVIRPQAKPATAK